MFTVLHSNFFDEGTPLIILELTALEEIIQL